MENKNCHKNSTEKLSKDFEDKLQKKIKHSFVTKSILETIVVAFLALSEIFAGFFKVLFVDKK